MLLLVDTNVLLRIVERNHPQHSIAVEATEILDILGHQLVTVPQIVYEFWAVATRPVAANGLGMSTAEAESEFNGLLPQFRVMRDERTIYERWREVVSDHDVKGKQVHDARIVAAMLRHNMSHLLTFNASDFTRYSAVAIVEPHQASALGPAE